VQYPSYVYCHSQLRDPGIDGYAYHGSKGRPIPCGFAREIFSPGGIVWGASGFGKSRFIFALAASWTQGWGATTRRLNLIDPKAETFEIIAMEMADVYRRCVGEDEPYRDIFVENIRVHDVLHDRFSPSNLFAVPSGMSAGLVAELRASTALEAFQGETSELVEHGIRLVFALATTLGVGLTMELVRAVMDKPAVRDRMLLPKIADVHLRERLRNIDSTLPEQSRAAVIRRFEILLSERTSRLIFGISPASYTELLGRERDAKITLQNFGPSLIRAPRVAISQAMNAVVSAVNDLMLRTEIVPDMLITEETGQLVRNATVARSLLDASRTLRWKGISLVCCAQDPTNAFPPEVLKTLALNARWFAAFQSGRTDAALFDPYLPTDDGLFFHNLGARLGETKNAFYTHMACLPQQHFVFLRKGLSAVFMKTRDVEDRRNERDELLEIFYNHIASRSMVRFDDAERLIEEEQQRLLQGEIAPSHGASAPSFTVDDLLASVTKRGTP
jgi:hypothetical protein